jgi:hypothetical protein
MMETLSYGYLKPTSPDRGPAVFPALEDNIERLNDHDHDGSNSAKIASINVNASVQNVFAASWVSLGGGNYRQLITVPIGVNLDTMMVNVRDSSGNYLWLTIERISSTTYYIYINDNTKNLTVLYTS